MRRQHWRRLTRLLPRRGRCEFRRKKKRGEKEIARVRATHVDRTLGPLLNFTYNQSTKGWRLGLDTDKEARTCVHRLRAICCCYAHGYLSATRAFCRFAFLRTHGYTARRWLLIGPVLHTRVHPLVGHVPERNGKETDSCRRIEKNGTILSSQHLFDLLSY